MPTENGITVYCEGKCQDLELSKREAEKFLSFAGVAGDTKKWAPPTEEQIDERRRRSSATEANAVAFKEQLLRIAGLESNQLALVFTLIEVMEFGDSWIGESVQDLLLDVQCSGVAKACERDPRMVLADLAFDLFDWWDNIDTAKQHAASHPALFAAEMPSEPPAVTERAQRVHQRAVKPSRAGKPRKRATA